MIVLPPLFLDAAARFVGSSLGRARAAEVLASLSRSQSRVIGVERMAAREPDPLHVRIGGVSPFVIEIDEAPLPGPLNGERVAIKDSFDIAGMRTGIGLRDGGVLASRDAAMVARIRAAGGRLAGKTKMTELGMDGLGALMNYRMPPHPVAPGYFPGGSSTGTAVAVALGLVRYGLGGDGLGSVRIPAAYCGLVGLKPTQDRLSADGYISPAPSMDVPGPLARTVADCARLWQVMAGEPIRDLEPMVPARVGIVQQLGPELATREMAAAFDRALARLGAERVPVEVPGSREIAFFASIRAAREMIDTPWRHRELSPAGRLNVALGSSLSESHVRELDVRRARLRDATHAAIERAGGLLAMPTTAIPSPAVTDRLMAGGQDALLMRGVGAYTPLANVTGVPAIAVPCGRDARGRPLSIMFMGAPGAETELLRVALALESG